MQYKAITRLLFSFSPFTFSNLRLRRHRRIVITSSVQQSMKKECNEDFFVKMDSSI